MRKLYFFTLSLISFLTFAQNITDYFTEQATGFTTPQRGIQNISVVDENIVWALAFDGSGNNEIVQEFTKTTDGGNTWVPGTIDLGVPSMMIGMLHAIDENTAWIVANPENWQEISGVYKTTDGGATWTRQPDIYNDVLSFPDIIYFWDSNKGIVIGDPVDGFFEIYTTIDGGINWLQIPESNIPGPYYGTYLLIGKFAVNGNRFWFFNNINDLFLSDDYCDSFSLIFSPICDFDGPPCISLFSFSTENKGYSIEINDKLFYNSYDGGYTWTLNFYAYDKIFNDYLYSPVNSELVFTSSFIGDNIGLSISPNEGQDWILLDNDTPLTDIKSYGEHCWVGGFNTSATEGGIYHIGNVSSLSTAKQAIKPVCQVFPNPVKNIVNIQSESNIDQIVLINVLGQKLMSLPVNTNNYQMNIENLPNALYFLKLTTSTQTETHRFIKK